MGFHPISGGAGGGGGDWSSLSGKPPIVTVIANPGLDTNLASEKAIRDLVTSLASGVSDGDKGDITVSGSGAVWTIDNDTITDAKLRNSAALSIIGRSANSTGDPADIAASSDGQVLRRSGTTLGFGTIATAGIADAAVSLAKLANIATARLIGRTTASTGVPEAVPIVASIGTPGVDTNIPTEKAVRDAIASAGGVSDGDKGDITVSGSGTVFTVDAGVITLAKLANLATARLIGRTTTGTGVPEAIPIVTSIGTPGVDTNIPTEKAVRDALAAIDYNDLVNVPTDFPPEAHTHVLSEITDVVITTPADLQFLQYDLANSRWVNTTPSIGDFADVDEVIGADNDFFVKNAGNWTNRTPAQARVHLDMQDVAIQINHDAPPNETFTVCQSSPLAGTIVDIVHQLASGTVNVSIRINGVDVTGIAAEAVAATEVTDTATAANTVAKGDKIEIVFASGSTPLKYSGSLRIAR